MSEVQIIDGDGHLIEDDAAIAARLPKPYRDAFLGGIATSHWTLFPPEDAFHAMPMLIRGWDDRAAAPFGVREWLEFLDQVGISKTVLYPSLGLGLGRVNDLDYVVALCQAYNDWLAETYIQHDSGRFEGAALLPMQVPSAAVEELQRISDLGYSTAMIPSRGLPAHLGSVDYWPVYEAAAALGCGVAIHGGAHEGMGFDDFNVFAPSHALGHPIGLLIALAGMVFNGVFDRYTGLRVAFLEGGSAWVLLALERLAESAQAFRPFAPSRFGLNFDEIDIREYLTSLCREGRVVVGCEGGEATLGTVIDIVGCTPFMYSSDFPHEVDHVSCLHEIGELKRRGLSDDAVHDILVGTAKRFYRLQDVATVSGTGSSNQR
jgi:uncharacterized protein